MAWQWCERGNRRPLGEEDDTFEEAEVVAAPEVWFHGVGVEGEAERVLGPLRGDDGVVAGDGAELGVGFDGGFCHGE